jgi:hypothetical protein
MPPSCKRIRQCLLFFGEHGLLDKALILPLAMTKISQAIFLIFSATFRYRDLRKIKGGILLISDSERRPYIVKLGENGGSQTEGVNKLLAISEYSSFDFD